MLISSISEFNSINNYLQKEKSYELTKSLYELRISKYFFTLYLISSGRGDEKFCAEEDSYKKLEELLILLKKKYKNMEIQLSIPEQSLDYYYEAGKNNVCTGGRMSLVVNYNGDVTFCERLLDNQKFIIGNI
ncbi:MAG: SPASM domain-containing protein [Lagierella massiliensis]|nr:SPASM domain-containing protein [Lagierella massiliensis]